MIESTELCSYCNEEFDYEASDKEALITCPHCGKITTQCNMCDRDKCEDCTLSKSADAINDASESLKKDLIKFLQDKGYWPGRMYLTEDNVRRVQEAIATYLSTRETNSTWQVKADYTLAGNLNIFITDDIEKREDKMEHNKAERRQFSGLDVPVEPKLDWYWLSDTNAGCEINKGGNIEDCAYTYCHKCIYSRYNAGKRKDFYKEFINSTPAIGQKELLDKAWANVTIGLADLLNKKLEKEQENNMDNVEHKLAEAFREFTEETIKKFIEDDNMKKAETVKPKVRAYFRNLIVPVEPERDWTWMLSNDYCPGCSGNCGGIMCRDCIYSSYNHKDRADFYDLTFRKSSQEQDFEIGDIVEYTVKYTVGFKDQEDTVTTPIFAVLLDKGTSSKKYLVYSTNPNQLVYLDLDRHKAKLIKKAK